MPVKRNPPERLIVEIPCLNEGKNIEETVADVMGEADRIPMELVVKLIDDGSTDDTAAKMEGLCRKDSRLRLVRHATNQGVGKTWLEVIAEAEPEDWVTGVPGDGEIVFGSIHAMLAKRHDYDLILGYYQNPIVRTLTRRLASSAFRRVTNFVYGWDFKYLNGMVLVQARHFQGLDVRSTGHAYGPEIVAKALLRNSLLRIGEAPFAARGRSAGGSKAFTLGGVTRAMGEFVRGFQSVSEYRNSVVRKSEAGASTDS